MQTFEFFLKARTKGIKQMGEKKQTLVDLTENSTVPPAPTAKNPTVKVPKELAQGYE